MTYTKELHTSLFTGRCPSSFGELLQGMLPSGEHFLVTIPIDLFSVAIFTPHEEDQIQVIPSFKTKTALFLNKLRTSLGYRFSGMVKLMSDIPIGKGLSSSTADLIAALRAIENYLGIIFPHEEINQILSEIEPSDGLHYCGSVAYNHRRCVLLRQMGSLPPLQILSIDEGGVLDTVSYNKKEKRFSKALQREYALLLEHLHQAFSIADIRKIGEIATISAQYNQHHNFKPHLNKVLAIARQTGCYGVINTHSGTCLGLLMKPLDPCLEKATALIKEQFNTATLQLYRTL